MTRDKKCMEHTWTYSPMNELFDRCRWCGETRARASKAPSSPVETTEPPKGPQAYTGVIRDADEAETPLTEALNRIERLWGVIRANGDTNSRLMRERDEARAEVKRMQYDLILGTDGIEP